MLIIRTMPYSLEEMIQIVSIRASAECIEVSDEALATMGEVGARTSLRYAVQLLTPSRIIAETSGRETVDDVDVEEVDELFFDAKASARLLAASEGSDEDEDEDFQILKRVPLPSGEHTLGRQAAICSEDAVTQSVDILTEVAEAENPDDNVDEISLEIFNRQALDLKAYMDELKHKRAEADRQDVLSVKEEIANSLSKANVELDGTLSFIDELNRRSAMNTLIEGTIEGRLHSPSQNGLQPLITPVMSSCDNTPVNHVTLDSTDAGDEGFSSTAPTPADTGSGKKEAGRKDDDDDYFDDDEDDDEANDPYYQKHLMQATERQAHQQ
ncbi:ruvbl1, partial [Symbiodinium microadriaticum]